MEGRSIAAGFRTDGFMRAYIVTMRPYLMFVSGTTGITGLSFARGLTPGRSLLIGIASFLSYGFGQALTDCFQTDTDSISAPYRPLTQGIVSKRQVLVVSILGLTVCVIMLSLNNPFNLLLGLIAGTGLASYTPFKRRWWAGPFYNAWIVAALCLMGFFAGGESPAQAGRSTAFLLMLAAVFFGYANFVLSGYFKDVEADRSTGYRTLPVVSGRKTSARVSDIFCLLMILPALLTIAMETPTGFPVGGVIAWTFGLAGTASAILGQIRLHRVAEDAEAHRAIVPAVHSYILLLSAIAAAQKPGWSIALAFLYGAFVMTMKFRPERAQI